MDNKEIDELLELRIYNSADVSDGTTIREYFKGLLLTLWAENEGFSGKRPFGNSGWEYDILIPLIRAKAVYGKIDEYGCVDHADYAVFDLVVERMIHRVFEKD